MWTFFNHHCYATDAELTDRLAKNDRPVMKLPTFKVAIDTKLTLFEDDSPSLQKLELIDETGYSRHPFTSSDAPVRGVRSVAQKMKIPINGFDGQLSKVPPSTQFPRVSCTQQSIEAQPLASSRPCSAFL